LIGRRIEVQKKIFHVVIVEVPMTSLSVGHVKGRVTFGKTRKITTIIRKDLLIISKCEAQNIV